MNRSNLFALVMAGGAGTRFWPASRAARPKQLLRLRGTRTMIQETMDRLNGLVPTARRLVLTQHSLVPAIVEQLPELPPPAIVGEPCKRDTAPCIGLAALWIARRDPQATMLVLPADHIIRAVPAFHQAVERGWRLVDADPGRIVTFGIPPSYPAEVFGYVERAGEPLDAELPAAYPVRQFREKPRRPQAEEFLRAGTFSWNSGIFLWRAATILAALQEYEPEMFGHLQKIAAAFDSPDFARILADEFAALRGKSIDYAVLERHERVCMIEAPFDWDDVGNWSALPRLAGTDAAGNTVQANHLGIDSRGCVVHGADGHLIVTIGVQDLIVVQTPDATLVASRQDEEKIREVVKQLSERGADRYL